MTDYSDLREGVRLVGGHMTWREARYQREMQFLQRQIDEEQRRQAAQQEAARIELERKIRKWTRNVEGER